MKSTNKMKLSVKSGMLFISLGVAITFITISFSIQGDTKWEVPEAAKKAKNPTDPADEESMALGKMLYMKHCKSCHGKTGEGDGPKAEELETPCGDFTTEAFHKQSDGELHYKTKEGRNDMPSFKKKITEDEDIWLIVNFVRTLAEG